jgi:hypothetical protein
MTLPHSLLQNRRPSFPNIGRLFKRKRHLQHSQIIVVPPDDLDANWQSGLRKRTRHTDYKSPTPSELENVLATAQRETRVVTARHADPADQAATEYERDCHKLRRLPTAPRAEPSPGRCSKMAE